MRDQCKEISDKILRGNIGGNVTEEVNKQNHCLYCILAAE